MAPIEVTTTVAATPEIMVRMYWSHLWNVEQKCVAKHGENFRVRAEEVRWLTIAFIFSSDYF